LRGSNTWNKARQELTGSTNIVAVELGATIAPALSLAVPVRVVFAAVVRSVVIGVSGPKRPRPPDRLGRRDTVAPDDISA